MAPMLSAKVAQWAAEPTLPQSPGPDGRSCASLLASVPSAATGAMEARPFSPAWWVERGVVKCPRRAVEKALACYGGDASRLLDVCRARMVVADMAALTRCLERIADDSAVRVLRVKDGVGRDQDPAVHGGYRVRGR